jgi:hypothetical protein
LLLLLLPRRKTMEESDGIYAGKELESRSRRRGRSVGIREQRWCHG